MLTLFRQVNYCELQKLLDDSNPTHNDFHLVLSMGGIDNVGAKTSSKILSDQQKTSLSCAIHR